MIRPALRSAASIVAAEAGPATVFHRAFVVWEWLEAQSEPEILPARSLAHRYAIEHDGRLSVGYSNNGGLVGRVGQGRELANNNSAELAVIPLASLRNAAAN
jgi:hypothetical protein